VDYFVRSQTWISPARGINEAAAGDPELDEEYNYTSEEIKRFQDDPEYLQRHRQILADRRIADFIASLGNPEALQEVKNAFEQSMIARLGSSEKGKTLASLIIPDFPVGCRRLTPGQGFLEAIVRDNVDTHWDELQQITEDGILLKNGTNLKVDAIICATGFDTTFKPRFPVVGKNGVNLTEKWEKGNPEAYFGITVPDMPNYFCKASPLEWISILHSYLSFKGFIGPNSPVSNGSLVQAIQMTGIYIYNCIEKLQMQGIKSMTISDEATEQFNEHAQEWLKNTVWAAPCRSWYKRGTIDGRIVGVYSGSCFHFAEALRDPRWEDYHFDYIRNAGKFNRFAYLGNGLTVRETRGDTVGDTQTLDFETYWRLMILPELHT
jgi:hypothetical protein